MSIYCTSAAMADDFLSSDEDFFEPGSDSPFFELSLWGKRQFKEIDFVTYPSFITPRGKRLTEINAAQKEVASDHAVVDDWASMAIAEGVVYRVFCVGDLAHTKIRKPQRDAFWSLVKAHPQLHWHVGTTRVEHLARSLPEDWLSVNYPNVTLVLKIQDDDQAQENLDRFQVLQGAHRTVIWDIPDHYDGDKPAFANLLSRDR